jgi:hypothetical protein
MSRISQAKVDAVAELSETLSEWISDRRDEGVSNEQILEELRSAVSICERPSDV